MAERRTIRGADGEAPSRHILPSAGTMVGLCTTRIGLVKVVEGRVGSSPCDEAAALTAVLFPVGAVASALSIRLETGSDRTIRPARRADVCVVLGRASLSMIAVPLADERI